LLLSRFPKTDTETGKNYYELVDGLQRFSAAQDAGVEKINVDIISLDDGQVLEAQIMANVHKVETRPVEYSQQLRRILAMNPLMTEAELATKLGKSPQWIKERLGLTKIVNEEIIGLIDDGKIGLANAYALAKLPAEEQPDFTDRAMTQAPDEFVPAVNARVKEIKEAKRQGKSADELEFQPVAFMQKMKDIKDELEKGAIAKALCKDLKTPLDGFKMAVQWCLHLDPKSVEVQKAKDEERKKKRAEAKAKRDADRKAKKAEKEKKKADEAAKAAAEAQAALK
jgi:ParB/RepB/Spo0J family partition protein